MDRVDIYLRGFKAHPFADPRVELQRMFGLSPLQTQQFLESLPRYVKFDLAVDDARRWVVALEQFGGEVELHPRRASALQTVPSVQAAPPTYVAPPPSAPPIELDHAVVAPRARNPLADFDQVPLPRQSSPAPIALAHPPVARVSARAPSSAPARELAPFMVVSTRLRGESAAPPPTIAAAPRHASREEVQRVWSSGMSSLPLWVHLVLGGSLIVPALSFVEFSQGTGLKLAVLLAPAVLGQALAVYGSLRLKSFAARCPRLTSAADMAALRREIRWQMYAAIAALPFLWIPTALGVLGILFGRLSIADTSYWIVPSLVGVTIIKLMRAETAVVNLPAEPAFEGERNELVLTWRQKLLPDF